MMPERGIPYQTPLGRQRHYIITDKNKHNVQNESINFPVSSLASDMTLLSLCDISEWITAEGLEKDVKIVNSVHDSIILELTDNDELVARVREQCLTIMAEQPSKQLDDVDIPFKADAEEGYEWGNVS